VFIHPAQPYDGSNEPFNGGYPGIFPPRNLLARSVRLNAGVCAFPATHTPGGGCRGLGHPIVGTGGTCILRLDNIFRKQGPAGYRRFNLLDSIVFRVQADRKRVHEDRYSGRCRFNLTPVDRLWEGRASRLWQPPATSISIHAGEHALMLDEHVEPLASVGGGVAVKTQWRNPWGLHGVWSNVWEVCASDSSGEAVDDHRAVGIVASLH
jgi:hypothetical protein